MTDTITLSREVIEKAINALQRCYDVESYPSDGSTQQDAALNELRAALAQQAEQGWQPMETAPKDGMPFRAYGSVFVDADFNPDGSIEVCFDGSEFIGCVWNGQQEAWYGKAIKFTHWMPLPTPPKEIK